MVAAWDVAAAGIYGNHRVSEEYALLDLDLSERPKGVPLQFREFFDVRRRALDRAGIAASSFSGASFAYLYSYRYL